MNTCGHLPARPRLVDAGCPVMNGALSFGGLAGFRLHQLVEAPRPPKKEQREEPDETMTALFSALTGAHAHLLSTVDAPAPAIVAGWLREPGDRSRLVDRVRTLGGLRGAGGRAVGTRRAAPSRSPSGEAASTGTRRTCGTRSPGWCSPNRCRPLGCRRNWTSWSTRSCRWPGAR
jgi:hypothetical protein